MNRKARLVTPGSAAKPPASSAPSPSANPTQTIGGGTGNLAGKVSTFLGALTPGGTPEAAGVERTYVVSYQLDFIRKNPKEKARQESMKYEDLQADYGQSAPSWPPYLYYGETVSGKYDPAQPNVIAVHAMFENKPVSGYIDSTKLWLEPPLDHAASDRYMAVVQEVSIYVVPDVTSPPVLTIMKGEVVDTVGQLDFRAKNWVKARFNVSGKWPEYGPEVPRYGFIPGSDLKPLTDATVDQSELALDEIP